MYGFCSWLYRNKANETANIRTCSGALMKGFFGKITVL